MPVWASGAAPSSIVAFDPTRRSLHDGSENRAFSADILRVLVVDDEDEFVLMRDLLGRAEETQFRLEWAHHADAALGRLALQTFDVCLVASAFPARSGLDLLRSVQRRGLRVPIVLVGDGDPPSLHFDALEAGAADFVDREEFDVERLERVLRAAVVRHRRDERRQPSEPSDEISGLSTGPAFKERLQQAAALARRLDMVAAVILVDLKGLDILKERVGSRAAAAALQSVGVRLAGQIRLTDTIAQLGPDRFAVLADGLAKPEDAAVVARKVWRALQAPIEIAGAPTNLPTSLGIALAPLDGHDPDALIAHAEAAVAFGKGIVGDGYFFHNDGLNERCRRQATLVRAVEGAIERRELALLFQPQVTLRPGHLGLATVLQWRLPELGTVGGNALIAAAEEAGCLEELTDWMLAIACRQAKLWHERGYGRLHVAVPMLSRRSLRWADLASRLKGHLDAVGLPPSWLEIEIAEELLLDDLRRGGDAVASVAELGVRIALQCYGSGPTSIAVLRGGSLATVKLAHTVLRDATQDVAGAALLKAIVALARQLNLRVVAQGIDTQAQLQLARALDCDAVQSTLSCPPLPADACTDWLATATQRG
ncbi:MAG: EAL domain-containing protein [Geminicoccaceae bacterium]